MGKRGHKPRKKRRGAGGRTKAQRKKSRTEKIRQAIFDVNHGVVDSYEAADFDWVVVRRSDVAFVFFNDCGSFDYFESISISGFALPEDEVESFDDLPDKHWDLIASRCH